MNTPAPHRKHHLCCAAAHLAVAVVALLERSLAVAEGAMSLGYADMAWRDRS
jgi:hypothetical protein